MLSDKTLKNLKIILLSILEDAKSSIRIEGHDERFQCITNMGVDVESLNKIYQDETQKDLHSVKDPYMERATMSLEKKFYFFIATFEYQIATCIECISKNTELSRGENIEILFRTRSVFELYGQLVDVFEKKRSSRPVGRGRKGQVWDTEIQDWRIVIEGVGGVVVPVSQKKNKKKRVANTSPQNKKQRVFNISPQNIVSENVISTNIAPIVESNTPDVISTNIAITAPAPIVESNTPDEIAITDYPQNERYDSEGLGEECFLGLFDEIVNN
jgi:hypothetical protein